jgi:asparagine synthase (glutamine-hydrolysing)
LGAHDYLRRKSSLVGLCDAHPFLDDLDLIEFVLRVSPEYAYDSRVSRPLLRAAMEGLLPPEVRRRPHKAAFNEFIEACLAGVDAPALERSVLAPDAEIRSFVDQETVRDVFFRPAPDDRPLGWAGIAWRLATAECWLRAQASGGVGG